MKSMVDITDYEKKRINTESQENLFRQQNKRNFIIPVLIIFLMVEWIFLMILYYNNLKYYTIYPMTFRLSFEDNNIKTMQIFFFVSFLLILICFIITYRIFKKRFREGYYRFKDKEFKKTIVVIGIIGIILLCFCLIEKSREENNKGFEQEIAEQYCYQWFELRNLTQNIIWELETGGGILGIVEKYEEEFREFSIDYTEYLARDSEHLLTFFVEFSSFMNNRILKENDEVERNDNSNLFIDIVKEIHLLSDTIATLDYDKRTNLLWENTKEGKLIREQISEFLRKFSNIT